MMTTSFVSEESASIERGFVINDEGGVFLQHHQIDNEGKGVNEGESTRSNRWSTATEACHQRRRFLSLASLVSLAFVGLLLWKPPQGTFRNESTSATESGETRVSGTTLPRQTSIRELSSAKTTKRKKKPKAIASNHTAMPVASNPTTIPALTPTASPFAVASAAQSNSGPEVAPSDLATVETISPSRSISQTRTIPTASPTRRCNGLASNCQRRVNEITFATVHNAMSSREDGFIGPNNLLPLEDALEAGFRGLMLDSCECGFAGVQLCHSFCFSGTRDPKTVFTSIVDFLTMNPSEVIILELQITDNTLEQLFSDLSEVSGLQSLMYSHPGNGVDWPLMGELIDMNERLIIFQHDGPDCDVAGACPVGVHNSFTYMFETPFDMHGSSELLDFDMSCAVSRGQASAPFFISNHFATDFWGLSDDDIATEVNAASNLLSRLSACQGRVSRNVSLLVVDFWSIGDVVAVVHSQNEGLGA